MPTLRNPSPGERHTDDDFTHQAIREIFLAGVGDAIIGSITALETHQGWYECFVELNCPPTLFDLITITDLRALTVTQVEGQIRSNLRHSARLKPREIDEVVTCASQWFTEIEHFFQGAKVWEDPKDNPHVALMLEVLHSIKPSVPDGWS